MPALAPGYEALKQCCVSSDWKTSPSGSFFQNLALMWSAL